MKLREADIRINGAQLSFTQSMTVRVALGSFFLDLHDEDFARVVGADTAEYLARLEEILDLVEAPGLGIPP